MAIIKGVVEVTKDQLRFLRRKYNVNITPDIDRRERAAQIRQELGIGHGMYRLTCGGEHAGILGV